MAKPKEVNDSNFDQEVLKAQKPVLVDFWAEWCGPCRMVSPIVEEIAEEYEDKIKTCKLNVDANQSTAVHYEIMSIPTLILFENGEIKKQVTGYMSKNSLIKKLGIS